MKTIVKVTFKNNTTTTGELVKVEGTVWFVKIGNDVYKLVEGYQTMEIMKAPKKWYVELKYALDNLNFPGVKIFPQADGFEIGGYRIILPNGKSTFVFYSDVVGPFLE
jgi:hypothetical protein